MCGLRSLGPEHSMEMAELAVSSRALAFDLAGDEQLYPLDVHAEALDYCATHGMPTVPHAGEWPDATLHNVERALDQYGAARIGHGLELGARGGAELLGRYAQAGVTVECNMTANIGGGRAGWYDSHPIRPMFDAGVRVTINSDNLLVSGSAETGPASPTGELTHLLRPTALGGAGFTLDEAERYVRMRLDKQTPSHSVTRHPHTAIRNPHNHTAS